MNASIVLDQPGNASLTNLDIISGRVVVRNPKPADVESILVKLEGESRTRLLSPTGPNGERPRPQMEYHKLLYKIQPVFPPKDVLNSRQPGVRATYTIPAGQHEYPFSFKLPFNNTCSADRSQMPIVIGFEVAQPASRHVKKTLPPTLSGFPGEAEIRYFVKATINRKSFFKENPRAYAPFNFFPIEPPRPPRTGSEIFARQRHQFQPFHDGDPSKGKMKNLFSKKSGDPATGRSEAPYICVDARLPQPAILTCSNPIPLRLIVKKLNEFSEPIYLQSLQISLIGDTKVRAHELFRVETNSWVILSKSNMNIKIGNPSDPKDHEHIIDDREWVRTPLPNTVAPTFETCNISRTYQVDVRIGFSYAGSVHSATPKPQTIILPMRLDVQVFSGIAPPAEVLARMAQGPGGKPARKPAEAVPDPMAQKLGMETQNQADFGSNQVPHDVEDVPPPSALPEYGDAPPSYEDAIASDVPPVMAPRPQYAPPPPGEDDILRSDEKKGFGG